MLREFIGWPHGGCIGTLSGTPLLSMKEAFKMSTDSNESHGITSRSGYDSDFLGSRVEVPALDESI